MDPLLRLALWPDMLAMARAVAFRRAHRCEADGLCRRCGEVWPCHQYRWSNKIVVRRRARFGHEGLRY